MLGPDPNPDEVSRHQREPRQPLHRRRFLLLLAIVVASGAAIGTQVSAAIVFVAGMLAVVEIVLSAIWPRRQKPMRDCDCCTTGCRFTVRRS
jgi:hypothetical protein